MYLCSVMRSDCTMENDLKGQVVLTEGMLQNI